MQFLVLFAPLTTFGRAAPPLSLNCGHRFEGIKYFNTWIDQIAYKFQRSDVCGNMCWGAYFTEPAFGVTLYYDNYGGTESRDSKVGIAR